MLRRRSPSTHDCMNLYYVINIASVCLLSVDDVRLCLNNVPSLEKCLC